MNIPLKPKPVLNHAQIGQACNLAQSVLSKDLNDIRETYYADQFIKYSLRYYDLLNAVKKAIEDKEN